MIDSKFNFRSIEKKIYHFWLENDFFKPNGNFNETGNEIKHKKKPFSMVIPPPNVTGRLHMGHALNNTIQDIIARFKRMQGYPVLWLPGTDHAGIATQTVVKKKLDSQNIDYRKFSRDEFVDEVWKWKNKYGDIILEQIKSLGSSCDWSRVRFTMDGGLVTSVNHAFKRLYQDGLIYKGKRMVNWCPVDMTALSDDEIEREEKGEKGFLYDIKYPIAGSDEFVVISTTRPETLFGDTAVAINPNDNRYRSLLGKRALIPLVNREVPIIADEHVKVDFGTGCLKVTPAHDLNDFELGNKHKLPFITVMDEAAKMNENVPKEFQKLDRYSCREKVLLRLQKENLLVRKKVKMIPLGRSYRSKEVIEYRLSDQWFIKMKPLAKKLMENSDRLNFYPAFYRKIWFHWLEDINDWCISRQIWWGHQIPAWVNQKTKEVIVDLKEPEVAKKDKNWKREPDVLDTWFSSALWPLSTLGWPDKGGEDFKLYFPNDTISTAKDIIFFWIARMCLFSLYFENKLPFNNIYFHPTVMDSKGKVMSKSKGNGIDPSQIINGATMEDLKKPILDANPSNSAEMINEIEKKYPNGFVGVGADALRFTLIYLSSNKQFIGLSLDDFIRIGRRFTNKLWNASRMLLLDLEKLTTTEAKEVSLTFQKPSRYDCWMDFQVSRALKKATAGIEGYDFSSLGSVYYGLVWNDFCDWYLELIKTGLRDQNSKISTLNNALVLLRKIIILAHPLIPFITEEINTLILKKLEHLALSPLIITPFLKEQKKSHDKVLVGEVDVIKQIISELRVFKKKNGIQENQGVDLFFKCSDDELKSFVREVEGNILRVGNFRSLSDTGEQPENSFLVLFGQIEFYLVSNDNNDKRNERVKLDSEINRLRLSIAHVEKKLKNKNFLMKGNPKVVAGEKEKLLGLKEKLNKITQLNERMG